MPLKQQHKLYWDYVVEPVFVEFACSPRACVGFLPQSKEMQVR